MKKIFIFSTSFLVVVILVLFINIDPAKAVPPPTPIVTTSTVTNITKTTVSLNGGATFASGPWTVTEWGFDYGADTDYGTTVLADEDPSVGNFSASISDLTCGTTYHVRAYATAPLITYAKPNFLLAFFSNIAHASPPPEKIYGDDVTFSTSSCSNGSRSPNIGISSGSTAKSRVTNLIALGKTQLAQQIAKEYNVQALNVTATSTITFERDLHVGSFGEDVKMLQQYLNSKGFVISSVGLGSVGNESIFFGPATKAALIKFQTANGIVPASGYFGLITRTYIQTH